jgi:hypothetical protein
MYIVLISRKAVFQGRGSTEYRCMHYSLDLSRTRIVIIKTLRYR